MRSFKSWMLLLVAAAGFSSLSAQAQHVFRPYVGLALTNYTIKFDNNAPNFGGGGNYQNKTAKANYLAPTIGFTWVSPIRVYVDAQYQSSFSATHDLWKDIPPGDQDFSRTAYAVTVGYVHVLSGGSTVSGFGGYTGGKSTLKAPRPPLTWSEDVFKSDGPFVGAAWGTPALGGSISISGALAFMKGKWTGDDGYLAEADSTTGFSFGAGYTYRITPALGITGDLRIQNYAYTFNPSGTAPDYKVNENIKALGVKVSYQF